MAKATARKAVTVRAAVPPEPQVEGGLSARLRALITRIRRPFMAFSEGYQALTQSRSQLAPEFMRAYGTYMNEVGGSFVSFVRLLDPEVPEDREGYRNHRSYQAAEYLRRLVNQSEAVAERRRRREAGEAPAPTPQTVALATLIATVLTLAPEAEDQVWHALNTLGLRPRQLDRLRGMLEETEPIDLEAEVPAAEAPAEPVASQLRRTLNRAAPTRTEARV